MIIIYICEINGQNNHSTIRTPQSAIWAKVLYSLHEGTFHRKIKQQEKKTTIQNLHGTVTELSESLLGLPALKVVHINQCICIVLADQDYQLSNSIQGCEEVDRHLKNLI